MNQRISEIINAIKSFSSEMPETMKALNTASKALVKASGQGVVGQGVEALKGVFGADTESQIHNLYTMFYNFKTSWPQIKQSVQNVINTNDPNTDDKVEFDQDLKNIQQLLIKALSPGLIKGTKAFAFLSPDVFANELIKIISDEATGDLFLEPLDTLASKIANFEAPQTMKLNPNRGAKNSTGGTKTTNGTLGSNPTQQTTSTKNNPASGTKTTDQTGSANQPISLDFQHKMITNSILQKLGRVNDTKAAKLISGVMKAIADQGYKLVKQ
jgi:hypothetical protein